MERGTRLLISLSMCFVALLETCPAYLFPNNRTTNVTHFSPMLLEELGKEINSNLMKLVATAFIDIEKALMEKIKTREISGFELEPFHDNQTISERACDAFVCSEWSDWSPCSWPRRTHGYGTIYRNRTCGVNSTLCTYSAAEAKVERQARLCVLNREGSYRGSTCYPNFTVKYGGSGEKFCLHYDRTERTHRDATDNCHRLGSNLVNVDSYAKRDAVNSLVTTGTIRINGQRADKFSPWRYVYGRDDFTDWASGEPSGGSTELCKVIEGSPRKQWDRECTSLYGSVCERVLI